MLKRNRAAQIPAVPLLGLLLALVLASGCGITEAAFVEVSIKVIGAGRVYGTGDIKDIDCGSDRNSCSTGIHQGVSDWYLWLDLLSAETLHAEPAPGWEFVTWSGDCKGTSPALPLPREIGSRVECWALFGRSSEKPFEVHDLTVDIVGSGSLSIDVDGAVFTQDEPFDPHTYTVLRSVPLGITAKPAEGYHFTGWSGPLCPPGQCLSDRIVLDLAQDQSLDSCFHLDTTSVDGPTVQVDGYNVTLVGIAPATQDSSLGFVLRVVPEAQSLTSAGMEWFVDLVPGQVRTAVPHVPGDRVEQGYVGWVCNQQVSYQIKGCRQGSYTILVWHHQATQKVSLGTVESQPCTHDVVGTATEAAKAELPTATTILATPQPPAASNSAPYTGSGPFVVPGEGSVLLTLVPTEEMPTIKAVRALVLRISVPAGTGGESKSMDFMIWDPEGGGWGINQGDNQVQGGDTQFSLHQPDKYIGREGELLLYLRNNGVADVQVADISVTLVFEDADGVEHTWGAPP